MMVLTYTCMHSLCCIYVITVRLDQLRISQKGIENIPVPPNPPHFSPSHTHTHTHTKACIIFFKLHHGCSLILVNQCLCITAFSILICCASPFPLQCWFCVSCSLAEERLPQQWWKCLWQRWPVQWLWQVTDRSCPWWQGSQGLGAEWAVRSQDVQEIGTQASKEKDPWGWGQWLQTEAEAWWARAWELKRLTGRVESTHCPATPSKPFQLCHSSHLQFSLPLVLTILRCFIQGGGKNQFYDM